MQTNKDGEQKQFKQYGLFSLTILLLTSSLAAQSFEDFKRVQESSFSQYRDARDKEFGNYLKAQWQEFSSKKPAPLYEKPKPKSITPTVQKKIEKIGPSVRIIVPKKVVAAPTTKPSLKSKESTKVVNVQPVVVVKPRVYEVVKAKKKQETQNTKDVNLLYFGQHVGINIDEKFKEAKFYPQNQSGISNAFSILASSDYEDTIRDIKTIQKDLNLNDWGVYLLVNMLSTSLFENPDNQKLFSWFIFNKLGYSLKVGLAGKHVVVMYYSKRMIYDTPYYTFNNKRFFLISRYAKGSAGRVYTYKQNYPKANKPLDLSLQTLPNFKKDLRSKTLKFKEFGKTYSTSFKYDKNLIDFMATYPQADYDTYFNAPMDPELYDQIARDLKPYIDGKKASVAINFVLHFVQKAFRYERDDAQFGREKVMFSNETLYYDKSDCEDRTILFAYLIKKLFNISVVGVQYSDHMSTALYIPMRGDSVKVQRRKFVIADPTYINANIGMSMPKYRSKIPESFIMVRK